MAYRSPFLAGIVGVAMLAGCGGGGSSSAGPATAGNFVPMQSVSRPAEADAIAQSLSIDAATTLVIHVGFKHAAVKSPKYGPVAFYAPNAGKTQVIFVKSGSKVAFLNDDTTRHTASGLGTTGFPKSFDNTSGLTPTGSTINGSLTWTTGSLNPNVKSKAFTVGPKGVYYFGCYYHYRVSPAMRDVLVSQ